MIELRNVSKSYAYPILSNINVRFEKGKISGIKGDSGAGKTTLLRMIAGLEPCDTGEIYIGRQLVSGPHPLVPAYKRNVGYGFQNNALWPHLKVWQQVAFPMGGYGWDNKEQAIEILKALGIEEVAGQFPAHISGGQAKRVSLARAFAAQPSIVLLDEPLVHVDSDTREKLCQWILQQAQQYGTTVLIVSHDDSELKVLSHVRYILNRGGLLLE